MKHICTDSDPYSNFTTILRVLSEQDKEPEFVLVEHSYALPWISQLEKNIARPIKTLFFNKLPLLENTERCDDSLPIDVELVSSNNPVLSDLQKTSHLMYETERHVNQKYNTPCSIKATEDSEEDWEGKINRFGWSENQNDIFSSAAKILNENLLAKLSLQGTFNEPVKRRTQTDIAAGKFRQLLGRHRWDMKLCPWLHTTLLYNLNKCTLAAYVDILQVLNSQIPSLIEKITALPQSYKGPIIEDLNLILKRPWDPVASVFNKFKPLKIDSPIIIQVPGGLPDLVLPQISRRFRFFNSQLQNLVKFVSVSVTSDLTKSDEILSFIASETRTKIVECKAQHPSRPVFLLGWGIGASLAANISLIEKVSGVICLGFSMMDHGGIRGDGQDPLLDLSTPALFVVGGKSSNVDIEELEFFRHQLPSPSSLVKIEGGDALLRISSQKGYHENLSQSIVDRCIVEEIGNFLNVTTLSDNNKNAPLMPFMNPLPPRVAHKRKLSSVESSNVPFPKATESRISQNLGLKIPVAVSDQLMSGSFTGLDPINISDENSHSSSLIDSSHLGLQNTDSTTLKNPLEASSSSSMTTISLGSLASLSRQKYQRMVQMSETSESSSNWKFSEDFGSVTSHYQSSYRAPASISGADDWTPEQTDTKTQPAMKFHPSSATNGEPSHIIVTSSVGSTPNKPKKQPGRRGRPPGRTNRGGGSAFRPLACAGAIKPMRDQSGSEESPMAVLTLTGEQAVENSSSKGISPLGRGVLTLSRGGTSAVRVYSANSSKTTTNKSLQVTNITSGNSSSSTLPSTIPASSSMRRIHGGTATSSVSRTVVYISSPSTVTNTVASAGTRNPLIPTSSQQQIHNVLTVEGSNTIHIPEPAQVERRSELDILAAAATELYKKENLYEDEPKSTINVLNKPLIKYISPAPTKTGAIRLIKPTAGRAFLKTAAIGTSSTGKAVTRTFTIAPDTYGGTSEVLNKDNKSDLASQSKVVLATSASQESKPLVRVSTSVGTETVRPLIKVTSLSSAIKKTSSLIKVAPVVSVSKTCAEVATTTADAASQARSTSLREFRLTRSLSKSPSHNL